jgi:hypothetical protein
MLLSRCPYAEMTDSSDNEYAEPNANANGDREEETPAVKVSPRQSKDALKYFQDETHVAIVRNE